MVETEEGGTELWLELFGDQVREKLDNEERANKKMLSETGNGCPNTQTLTSNRRGTQTLEEQVERRVISWLFFFSNS